MLRDLIQDLPPFGKAYSSVPSRDIKGSLSQSSETKHPTESAKKFHMCFNLRRQGNAYSESEQKIAFAIPHVLIAMLTFVMLSSSLNI